MALSTCAQSSRMMRSHRVSQHRAAPAPSSWASACVVVCRASSDATSSNSQAAAPARVVAAAATAALLLLSPAPMMPAAMAVGLESLDLTEQLQSIPTPE